MSLPLIDLSDLEKQLGLSFSNDILKTQIFVHRSYLNENHVPDLESNERLEFLGDAVLELIVTDDLYHRFPSEPEGELTALRSAIVKRGFLAAVARDLDLGRYLLFSKGESQQGGDSKDYILANTMEALIGAVYLEHGYEAARKVVLKTMLDQVEDIYENKEYVDSKSLLQEKSQESVGVTPHYELLREFGPDHDKRFEMGVFLQGEHLGTGEGSSKRKAEERAARAALKAKEWL